MQCPHIAMSLNYRVSHKVFIIGKEKMSFKCGGKYNPFAEKLKSLSNNKIRFNVKVSMLNVTESLMKESSDEVTESLMKELEVFLSNSSQVSVRYSSWRSRP